MESNVIAISIFSSLFATFIILLILVNVFCLWQGKRCSSGNGDVENGDGSCLTSRQYQLRTYMGCLPRSKRRSWRIWKSKYGYSMRPCWFTLCACCKELRDNEQFLDQVFVPPAIIIAPAPMGDKGLPRASVSAISTASMEGAVNLRGPSIPKVSILAPDPIVVSMGYTPSQTSIQEDTEPVSFYVYQLEGKAGERMLY